MSANGSRYRTRYPMAWQETVGGLIDSGAIAKACCSRCGVSRPANLDAIAQARGRNFSLWNRDAPCRTPACQGRVFFHASLGAGTPSRPLRS